MLLPEQINPAVLTRYPRGRDVRGFTLVEMMIVVAVVAILATLAVPSFNDWMAKNRTLRAAEDIYGLVMQARAEAPIRDIAISVSVMPEETPWCVGFSATPNCDCSSNECTVNVAGANVVQEVRGGTGYPGVTIASDPVDFTFLLPRNNLAGDAGAITVSNSGWEVDIAISAEGRVSLCVPAGADSKNARLGYQQCDS